MKEAAVIAHRNMMVREHGAESLEFPAKQDCREDRGSRAGHPGGMG
ncbi:MAG: hypothetical protein ACM3X6_14310 [Patescibacteria group bacterium]